MKDDKKIAPLQRQPSVQNSSGQPLHKLAPAQIKGTSSNNQTLGAPLLSGSLIWSARLTSLAARWYKSFGLTWECVVGQSNKKGNLLPE